MAALCGRAHRPLHSWGPPDLLSRPTGPESGGSTAARAHPSAHPQLDRHVVQLRGRPVFGGSSVLPGHAQPHAQDTDGLSWSLIRRPRVGCQPLVSPLWTDAHLQNEWGFLFDPFLTQAWTPPPSPGVPTQRIFREDWNPWIPPRTGEPGLELRELQFPPHPACLGLSMRLRANACPLWASACTSVK